LFTYHPFAGGGCAQNDTTGGGPSRFPLPMSRDLVGLKKKSRSKGALAGAGQLNSARRNFSRTSINCTRRRKSSAKGDGNDTQMLGCLIGIPPRVSEAGRCRPASGFEIRDALRRRVRSYGAETRSHLSDERLREVLRTQQKQHLSSLLSFAKASWYPSGQLRIMSAMVGPPLIRASNGTRRPGSSCVHDENYNLPNSWGRQPISKRKLPP
jgi:hypothetical protein